MKRFLAALALVAFAMPAAAQTQNTWASSIKNAPPRGGDAGHVSATLHNLNTRMGQATRPDGDIQSYQSEICIYCHSPHKGTSTNQPLWNRTNPTTTYTTYYAEGIVGGRDQQQPGPSSLTCLSCHDGTVALDAVANKGNYPAPASLGGKIMGFANVNDAASLTNDHPIGVDYPTSVATAPAFNDIATVTSLRLYQRGADGIYRVECASCHDPHKESANHRFERVDNAGSALCLTCHKK